MSVCKLQAYIAFPFQINGASASDTEAVFLDLLWSISNDIVSTKIDDKCDGYDFGDVTFTFLGVPRSASCGVCVSQLICFARASSHVADLNTCNELMTQRVQKKVICIMNFVKPFLNFVGKWPVITVTPPSLKIAVHIYKTNMIFSKV